MKTKIASFLSIAALSLLTLATGSFADDEDGLNFYDKDHVRGFVSIGADYRGMRKDFQKYVNNAAFANYGHLKKATISTVSEDESSASADTILTRYYGDVSSNYKGKFNDYYLGLHLNVGAQYKQFLTWLDFNFMPPQTSEAKHSYYVAYAEIENALPSSIAEPLYDVEWYTFGADWMFGWKLFGESSVINLIPSIGFGFNIINFHLASSFDVNEVNNVNNSQTLRDRFYSTMATTASAELELRFELGRFAVGGYGGYRFVRYNELELEGFNVNPNPYGTDNVGDTYYFGARITFYFLSKWEKKQANKL